MTIYIIPEGHQARPIGRILPNSQALLPALRTSIFRHPSRERLSLYRGDLKCANWLMRTSA